MVPVPLTSIPCARAVTAASRVIGSLGLNVPSGNPLTIPVTASFSIPRALGSFWMSENIAADAGRAPATSAATSVSAVTTCTLRITDNLLAPLGALPIFRSKRAIVHRPTMARRPPHCGGEPPYPSCAVGKEAGERHRREKTLHTDRTFAGNVCWLSCQTTHGRWGVPRPASYVRELS